MSAAYGALKLGASSAQPIELAEPTRPLGLAELGRERGLRHALEREREIE